MNDFRNPGAIFWFETSSTGAYPEAAAMLANFLQFGHRPHNRFQGSIARIPVETMIAAERAIEAEVWGLPALRAWR